MTGSNKGDTGLVKQGSVISGVTSFFTSVKTTIAVLGLLAVASVLGTVIPQNVDLEQFRQTASPFYYRLVVILDLHDVYRSWWFTLLLLVLAGNLLGCLLERLPRIPKEWKGASAKGSIRFSNEDSRNLGEIQGILASSLGKLLGSSPTVLEEPDGVRLVWVKQRIFLLAFPLIHTAIIVILLGGLIGLFYGLKGNIRIEEGETGNKYVRFPSRQVSTLPFDIAVDKFTLKRYPTGQPKEFRSDVRLLKDNKEVKRGSILVNQPLTYEGISLYQANYDLLGLKQVSLKVVSPEGKASQIVVHPPEPVQLPGTPYQILILSVDPGSSKRGAGVDMRVTAPGEEPKRLESFRNDSQPVKVGNHTVKFMDYEPLYATGLQIGYDPGTNVVWVGCGLLIAGFCLTLFTNLRSLTVKLSSDGGKTRIEVSGRSRKDRTEFRESVEATVREGLGRT